MTLTIFDFNITPLKSFVNTFFKNFLHIFSAPGKNTNEVIVMQLTKKEELLVKDMKNAEKLCAEKYEKYAQSANDAQLKTLCEEIAKTERGHYETLCDIENGKTVMQGGQSGASPAQKSFTQTYDLADTDEKKHDLYITSDLLMTEKEASHLYDTCIFEFAQEPLRNALNHIQKEEQQHGKAIYDYMQKNNMYN